MYIPYFLFREPRCFTTKERNEVKIFVYFSTDLYQIKSEKTNPEKDNSDPSITWLFYRVLAQIILHCKVSVKSGSNLFEEITEVVFKNPFKFRHRNR